MNQNIDALADLRPYATTVDRMFVRAGDRWPDRNFVVSDGRSLTYADMAVQVDQAARGLMTLGVQPGDRVALWMSNIWEWIVVQFAVTRVGAVLTPINTRLRIDDLGHILGDSGATVLLTQGRSAEFSYVDIAAEILTDPARTALKHIVVARPTDNMRAPFLAWDDFMAADERSIAAAQPCRDATELAYILYTSGTTSLPKGVMLSHACLNNAINFARCFGEGDTTLLIYPLFAITGCHNTVLKTLLIGGTVVLQERYDPGEALALIETHRCTVIGCLISVLEDIASLPEFAPERVRPLRIANVFPRRPEHLALLNRFGLETATTGYGMTETCGPVCFVADLDPTSMLTEGLPWPGDEVRLITEDSRDAEPDEDGAIIVRSPHNMIGYFRNPDATAKTIDSQGWLHTGDVGRRDRHGRITWVGRWNDIIKSSGFNFAAQEVEAYLGKLATIEEVSVVGVPDRGRGEVGAAFVVAAAGASLSLDAIRQHCHGRIASYKIPGHLFLREALPKTASGKVRKVELKAWFLEQQTC